MENNLNTYKVFVDTLTSNPSKEFDAYITSLTKLRDAGCDIPRLDTAANGLMSESGEVM